MHPVPMPFTHQYEDFLTSPSSPCLDPIGQAFHQLPDDDKTMLGDEMARTGIQGQSYSTAAREGGPAFLVRARHF